jgi:hypothetical protein
MYNNIFFFLFYVYYFFFSLVAPKGGFAQAQPGACGAYPPTDLALVDNSDIGEFVNK